MQYCNSWVHSVPVLLPCSWQMELSGCRCRQVEGEIAAFFDEVDPDGSCTGFEPGDLEEHHRVVAETISLAIERGDVEVVRSILSNITVGTSTLYCALALGIQVPCTTQACTLLCKS